MKAFDSGESLIAFGTDFAENCDSDWTNKQPCSDRVSVGYLQMDKYSECVLKYMPFVNYINVFEHEVGNCHYWGWHDTSLCDNHELLFMCIISWCQL